MSGTSFIKVAFFDLGGTLIGNNRDWIPGAQKALAQLSEKQIRLGLISNTGDLSRPSILKLLPQNFALDTFEENLVIFSSEVSIEKPAPEIFQLAIKRAQIKSVECLFCTEEVSHIAVAQQQGMQTVSLVKPPRSNISELTSMLINRCLLPS